MVQSIIIFVCRQFIPITVYIIFLCNLNHKGTTLSSCYQQLLLVKQVNSVRINAVLRGWLRTAFFNKLLNCTVLKQLRATSWQIAVYCK